ncbi:MAG: hypothetical protein Q4F97_05810 [Bacteroidales bacterium]|nr:hypothetical protein [Bacteroidales bacterium]
MKNLIFLSICILPLIVSCEDVSKDSESNNSLWKTQINSIIVSPPSELSDINISLIGYEEIDCGGLIIN